MTEKKILVVDDEVAILNMLKRVFSKEGYTVRSAESAEEAIEILKHDRIHVMFLDLNLPGMTGVELCRQLRKKRPMDIIYAVTGYVSLFELAECREAGFDDYFHKPVELEELLNAAQDAFKKIERWKKR